MNKKQALLILDDIVESVKSETHKKNLIMIPDTKEFSKSELMDMEYNALGLYLKDNPLSFYKNRLATLTSTRKLSEKKKGEKIEVGGRISDIKTITTKIGKEMAFIKIEDLVGRVEVVIFSHLYPKVKDLLFRNSIIEAYGELDMDIFFANDQERIKYKVKCQSLKPMVIDRKIGKIIVNLGSTNNLETLTNIISNSKGNIPVSIRYDKFEIVSKKSIAFSAITELEGNFLVERHYERT